MMHDEEPPQEDPNEAQLKLHRRVLPWVTLVLALLPFLIGQFFPDDGAFFPLSCWGFAIIIGAMSRHWAGWLLSFLILCYLILGLYYAELVE